MAKCIAYFLEMLRMVLPETQAKKKRLKAFLKIGPGLRKRIFEIKESEPCKVFCHGLELPFCF